MEFIRDLLKSRDLEYWIRQAMKRKTSGTESKGEEINPETRG